MTELTRRPTAVSRAAAAGAALVAVFGAGYASATGLLLGLVGAGLLVAGATRGRVLAIDAGFAALFLGVVVGGYEGGSVELALVGTVGTVVAWDVAGSGADLGEQLGREADAARLEAVHVVSSVAVGVLTVTVGYALYAFAAGGQPVAAVALLLVSAALITVGLGVRYRDSGSGRGRRAP